jgi:hypothetical protein
MKSRRTQALIGLVAMLAACSSGNVIGPENQPEIANNTDSFEFQVTGLDNVSETLSYTWQNTGTQANVNRSSSVSAGSGTLIVRDADGTEVFRGDLSENSTVATSSGVAGTWQVQVAMSGVSGTLNFRLEKTT